jgi:uncharacterized protein (DUF433 family)
VASTRGAHECETRPVTAEQLALISTHPQVMHGQAVVTGTRVPVSVVFDCLASVMSVEAILDSYPP